MKSKDVDVGMLTESHINTNHKEAGKQHTHGMSLAATWPKIVSLASLQ